MKKIEDTIASITVNDLDKVETVNALIRNDYADQLVLVERKKDARYEMLEEKLKIVKKYSTFSSEMMGPILAELFTLYTGSFYEYKFLERSIESNIRKTVYLENKSKIGDIKLADFKWADCLVFKFYDYEININSAGTKEILIKKHDLIDSYDFIKDFINFVVEYRIKNKIDDVNLSRLKQLQSDFVKLHKDELETLQQDIYKHDLETVEDSKEKRKAIFDMVIGSKG